MKVFELSMYQYVIDNGSIFEGLMHAVHPFYFFFKMMGMMGGMPVDELHSNIYSSKNEFEEFCTEIGKPPKNQRSPSSTIFQQNVPPSS
jgi:hypothetical protein